MNVVPSNVQGQATTGGAESPQAPPTEVAAIPGASTPSVAGAPDQPLPLPQALIDGTREALSSIDLPEDVVSEAVSWLDKGLSHSQEELAAIDAADTVAAERELKHLWGSKYNTNLEAIKKYVDQQLPAGMAEMIRNARRADGHAIGNDPAQLQRLLGRALKPVPTAPEGDLDTQIESIEKFMRTNRSAYNRDEVLQARYRRLLGSRELQQ